MKSRYLSYLRNLVLAGVIISPSVPNGIGVRGCVSLRVRDGGGLERQDKSEENRKQERKSFGHNDLYGCVG